MRRTLVVSCGLVPLCTHDDRAARSCPPPPTGTCSVGAAHACFNLARDHIKVRKQFQQPLAANQVRGLRQALTKPPELTLAMLIVHWCSTCNSS